jgi:oxygen-independent coproporphyrinogen-3 oxidase
MFFGGGTPTVLNSELLIGILDCCFKNFHFDADAEISVEANPDTVSLEDLCILRAAGFNRISFGVQSFIDDELRTLGRIHDAQRAVQAVRDARSAGFDNLSLDLMYGLPGQTVKTWRTSLERAMLLAPDHLSAYQLSIEDGTDFAILIGRGELHLPDEELIIELDAITAEITAGAGFEHYEISNYARPGSPCRHNIVYWNNEEYLGFGAGAVSYRDGVRIGRIKDPEAYCSMIEQGREPVETSERLDRVDSLKETVIMGLRLNRGVSENRLQQRYGMGLADVYGATLDSLIEAGLVVFKDQYLRLSERGRSLANLVMAELV